MNKYFTSISIFALLILSVIRVNAQVTLVPFASGFTNPTDVKNAGDDRLFVVEQPGYIKIVSLTGVVNPVKFLDIHTMVNSGGEMGLLGLAFSPNFSVDRRFYVNFTDNNGNSHISRFLVSATNRDSAIASSQETLLLVTQPETNHNGGDLHFGADGYLYCSFGDGGGGGDMHGTIGNGQNLLTHLGKILRINVDVPTGYSVPSDNPFFTNPNAYHEIWAFGLRNPWRTSFDRITHDYWIADVGQNAYEEVDFQPASSTGGENYGWRCYEANNSYNPNCGTFSNFVYPIYNYPHSASCSITGGYVYRGAIHGNMYGKYYEVDYCDGTMHSITPNGAGGWTVANEGTFSGYGFGAFGEDVNGELYIAANTTGAILKVTTAACNPTASISVTDTINFCGDSYALSTPFGAGFFYAWYKDGVGIQASGDNTLIATQSGFYYVNVLAPNACTATSDSVYLNLQSAPVVDFTGLPSFVCINQGPFNLVGIPAGGTFSGNGVTGATFDPVAAGVGSHHVTYSYLAASGCTATKVFTVAVDQCLSVEENSPFRNLSIVPNPNNGQFQLYMTLLENVKTEIEVVNIFGQKIYEQTVSAQPGSNNINIDLKDASAGIYFLRIKSNPAIVSRKFVISK